jgi:hypothetical protein
MSRTLPASQLQGWHEGMTQLRALSAKLDALDHQKGKYLTGSELKTMVWQITSSFASAVPVEEQLRLLEASAPGRVTPRVSIEEASRHLDSLSFILLTAQTSPATADAQAKGAVTRLPSTCLIDADTGGNVWPLRWTSGAQAG